MAPKTQRLRSEERSSSLDRLVERATEIATKSRRLNGPGVLGFRYIIESMDGSVTFGELDGDEIRAYGEEFARKELRRQLDVLDAARYVVLTNYAMVDDLSAVPGVLVAGCEPGMKSTGWVFHDSAFAAPVIKPAASQTLPIETWFTDLFAEPNQRSERDPETTWEQVCAGAGGAGDLMDAAREYMRSAASDTINKHAVIFRGKWWNLEGIFCLRFGDQLYTDVVSANAALEVLEMSLFGSDAKDAVLVERTGKRIKNRAKEIEWGDEFVVSALSREERPRRADFKVIPDGDSPLVTVYDDGRPVWKAESQWQSRLATLLTEALKPDYAPRFDPTARMALTAAAEDLIRKQGMMFQLVWSMDNVDAEQTPEVVH